MEFYILNEEKFLFNNFLSLKLHSIISENYVLALKLTTGEK